MSQPIYIPDIIGQAVKATNDTVLSTIRQAKPEIAQLNYQFGHPRELATTLDQWGASPNTSYLKYPLVWLVTDFQEQKGQQTEFFEVTRIRIIIATMTQGNYKGYERLNNIFKPILYPIYYEFLNQLSKHPAIHVQSPNLLPHTKTDRFFWGSQPSNTNAMNDYCDAIEIENLTLNIINTYCTPPINGIKRLNSFT